MKEERVTVGLCGLLQRDYLEHPDIGFAFLPEYTGRGIGFEAASATVTYAKDILKLPAIMAITLPDNQPSLKVLEKTGFRFLRHIPTSDGNEKLLLMCC